MKGSVNTTDTVSGAVAPESARDTQRVDRWLWFARILKTRTLASKLVDSGKVRINREKIDKPAHPVHPGDVLTLTVHHRVRILKVVGAGTRRGPAAEAALLYEDLSPPEVSTASDGGNPDANAPHPDSERGRPTKQQRRALERFANRTPEGGDG